MPHVASQSVKIQAANQAQKDAIKGRIQDIGHELEQERQQEEGLLRGLEEVRQKQRNLEQELADCEKTLRGLEK